METYFDFGYQIQIVESGTIIEGETVTDETAFIRDGTNEMFVTELLYLKMKALRDEFSIERERRLNGV